MQINSRLGVGIKPPIYDGPMIYNVNIKYKKRRERHPLKDNINRNELVASYGKNQMYIAAAK